MIKPFCPECDSFAYGTTGYCKSCDGPLTCAHTVVTRFALREREDYECQACGLLESGPAAALAMRFELQDRPVEVVYL